MPTVIEFLRDELGCTQSEISSFGFETLLGQYTAAQKRQFAQDFKKIKSLAFNSRNAGNAPDFHAIISNEKAPAESFLKQKHITTASVDTPANAVILSPSFCIENMDNYASMCESMSPEEAAAQLYNAALWINNVLFVAALQERRSITIIDANPNTSLAKLEIARRAKYQTELSFVFSDKAPAKVKDMLIAIMNYLNPVYKNGEFIHRVNRASLNWAEEERLLEFASFAAEHKPYRSSREADESATVDLAYEFRRKGEAGAVELNGNRSVNAQMYVNRLESIISSLESQHNLTKFLASRLRAMLTNWNSSTPYGSPRATRDLAPQLLLTQFKAHQVGDTDLEGYVVVDEKSPGTGNSNASSQTADSEPKTTIGQFTL